jgi:hypothetical protein
MYFSLILLPGNKRNVACAHRFKGETDESCPFLDVNGLSRSFVGLAHIWAERGFGGGIKLGPFRYLNGLSKSLVGLAHIWAERGFGGGIKLGPFDALLNSFLGDFASIPCIWQQNCADEFVAIDALGYVGQCDCRVSSYPDFFRRDPYHQLHKTPSSLEQVAAKAGSMRAGRTLPVLRVAYA